MCSYWKEFPPLHVLLKGLVEGLSGAKVGKSAAASEDFKPSSASELMQGLGMSG